MRIGASLLRSARASPVVAVVAGVVLVGLFVAIPQGTALPGPPVSDSGHQARYSLTFQETGLRVGDPLTILFNGTVKGLTIYNGTLTTTSSTSLTVAVVNGTYSFFVPLPGCVGPTAVNSSVASPVKIDGTSATVQLQFTYGIHSLVCVGLNLPPYRYWVSFTETGLPASALWSPGFGTTVNPSSAQSVSYVAANGSYPFSVTTSAAGFAPTPASGTAVVRGAAASQAVVFARSSSAGSSGSGAVLGLPPTDGYAVLAALLIAAGVGVALGFRRRRRNG